MAKKLNGTVIVTYRCNARCNMCNRYKAPSKPEEEISLETIRKLLQLRDSTHGPEVLIGAGVKAGVIAAFREEFPNARAFHMSGKADIESGMHFRRDGVPMGLPGLDEWHIARTSEEAVRAAKQALRIMQKRIVIILRYFPG